MAEMILRERWRIAAWRWRRSSSGIARARDRDRHPFGIVGVDQKCGAHSGAAPAKRDRIEHAGIVGILRRDDIPLRRDSCRREGRHQRRARGAISPASAVRLCARLMSRIGIQDASP